MTKTKRLLSMLLAVLMVLSAISGITITASAAGASDSATKESSDLNKFIYNPMSPATTSRYGAPVPSGITFVCQAWASAKDGDTVYMSYDGAVYKAIKGLNAFATIGAALQNAGKDNMTIKVGPGTYTEGTTTAPVYVEYNGIKIYGNYAGVDPNVDTAEFYKKDLNPERSSTMESVIKASYWEWKATANNFHMDGFKITDQTSSLMFKACASGAYIYGFEMINCIFDNCKGAVNMNYGFSSGAYFRHNRIVNSNGGGASGAILYAGATIADIVFEDNYFENSKTCAFSLTSCGGATEPTLMTLENNVFNNCDRAVFFGYKGNHNDVNNYDYRRIVNNVFYKCGSTSKYIIGGQYYLQYNNPASKTVISDNLFYSIPSDVAPVSFTGAKNDIEYKGEFVASVNDNRFVYASSNGKSVSSSMVGTVDMSYNFFGYVNGDQIVPMTKIPDFSKDVDATTTTVVASPIYADYDMTKLISDADLTVAPVDVLTAFGFDCATYGADAVTVDNTKMMITAYAANGVETVKFAGKVSDKDETAVVSANSEMEIYTDFVLSRPVQDQAVNLTGDLTKAYLVVTDKTTGKATKYYLAVVANTDKTKSEIRFLVNEETLEYHDNYTVTGTDIKVILESKEVYFPFSLVVSPEASYKLYTDSALTKEYDDETFYIRPDADVVLYAKVTSGDGTKSTVYTLTFNRQGEALYDASIIGVAAPLENVSVFKTRKVIVYRPDGYIPEVTFDFEVTPNVVYSIYSKYDEATGELSGLVTSSEDNKAIALDEAINYFYVEAKSAYGYSQVYILTVYNDIKVEHVPSDDNVITSITGIEEDVTVVDDVIYVNASSTVTAVNAHFKTDFYATVICYVDEERTFEVAPEITYTVIQKVEVPVRTFRLGITARVAYYYLDVISESGLKNTYKVIITKDGESNPFSDIEGHWAQKYIEQVGDYGIITGYYDENKDLYTFSPNNYVNRQEVAAMLLRMMGIDQMAFKNANLDGLADADSVPDWSYNYVKGVYNLGIMVGSDNEKGERVFNPTAKISRQEIFQAITNLLELDTAAAADVDLSKYADGKSVAKWAVPATKAVIKAGIIEGNSDNKLNPKANITRAEMTKIIALTNVIHEDLE